MSIEFKDPPPDPRSGWRPNQNEAVAEALRARPEEWALCFTGRSQSYGGAITAGRVKAFPKGEFEATSRKTEDGKYNVWVRYIGGAP